MADPINKNSKIFELATSQTWQIPGDTETMEDSATLTTQFSTNTVMVLLLPSLYVVGQLKYCKVFSVESFVCQFAIQKFKE